MSTIKSSGIASSRDRLRESAKALFAESGYEKTTTAAICRLAGTSQSQLIKHFVDKDGILQAIFEYAWEQINPAVRLATESIPDPREKLRVLIDMVLGYLEKDRTLRTLFLLEGRRVRGGHMVVVVPGFVDFVKMVDGVMRELANHGYLPPEFNPQAARSALMGAIEGMLRDHMLARTSHFPGSFTEPDMRIVLSKILHLFLGNPGSQ
jgi:TetR/AcrR family transcriptional regulator, transcriptional repressor of aconitase